MRRGGTSQERLEKLMEKYKDSEELAKSFLPG
jgi:hypothetical protein